MTFYHVKLDNGIKKDHFALATSFFVLDKPGSLDDTESFTSLCRAGHLS